MSVAPYADLCARLVAFIMQNDDLYQHQTINVTYTTLMSGDRGICLQYSCHEDPSPGNMTCIDIDVAGYGIRTHITDVPAGKWKINNVGCTSADPINCMVQTAKFRHAVGLPTIVCRLAPANAGPVWNICSRTRGKCSVCSGSASLAHTTSTCTSVKWFANVVLFVNCSDLINDLRINIAYVAARLLAGELYATS